MTTEVAIKDQFVQHLKDVLNYTQMLHGDLENLKRIRAEVTKVRNELDREIKRLEPTNG